LAVEIMVGKMVVYLFNTDYGAENLAKIIEGWGQSPRVFVRFCNLSWINGLEAESNQATLRTRGKKRERNTA